MRAVELNGEWALRFGPQGPGAPREPQGLAESGWREVGARVPGNVELDLMRAGLIDEPSVGERVYGLREFESYDWWYQRRFPSPVAAVGQRVELVFEGLDCFATIWLNGHRVGRADNMLIAHRFDVTDQLRRDGENQLTVRLASAVLEGRRRCVTPGEFASAVNYESLAVRKAPHSYGWDILPRLVSAGIWRDVRLEVHQATEWRDVYVTTAAVDAAKRTARAMVAWNFATNQHDLDPFGVRLTITNGEQTVHRSEHPALGTHGRAWLDLTGVDLWWPRGLGKANLYIVQLELLDREQRVIDVRRQRIGLRTIELDRTDLTSAGGQGQFRFVVNGEPVFVKGTNWVPLDALHSRDAAHLPAVFAMVVDLNCNMLRCWGGNVYEDHAFFDLCDENGVMVWQDFAMGCAVYPQDDGFLSQIEREASSVVTKLRNHASLALWAGNNEGDEAYEWAQTGVDPNTDRLTRQVLPAVVRQLDPMRPFLPSSPYRAPAFFAQKQPAADVLPEQHLWGPRDDFKGATYARSAAHFASEIGWHGCPSVESLQQFIEPGHLWPWQDNPQWLAHAVRPQPQMTRFDYRIPLMAKQIELLFGRVPEKLEDYVLASQISQAEAFKFFIEFFRQGKWRRTGILWWNLRDGWPVISDAIVDYYNRKKLAYEYVKRVQSDVCVICCEPTDGGEHALVVVNDTLHPATGRVTLVDLDAGTIVEDQPFQAPANGRAAIVELPQFARPAMWKITWTLEDGRQGTNHYLAGPRPFVLADYRRWLRQLL